tara:strand:+ start:18322 stop:18522 length:201 start_codon:yes stop_codon:yes gene_type:complete
MNAYETFCLENATTFAAVRGARPATRIRQEFSTMREAKQFGAAFGDCRTMIYAVTEYGNNAHICNA